MEEVKETTQKHAGGRPKIYSDEILKKTREYIDQAEDEVIQLVKQENGEKGYVMYENRLKVKLPSIEGLAYFLKISRDTIYSWCAEHEEFSDIIEELKAKQAKFLIENGLSGLYNPTIAKVILSKHGYVEKTETENSHKFEGELNEEQKAKLDNLLIKKPKEEKPKEPEKIEPANQEAPQNGTEEAKGAQTETKT